MIRVKDSVERNSFCGTTSRRTEGVADCATPIPDLTFFRREAPARPAVCLMEPSLVLVAQGAKRLLVGGEGYVYDPEHFLITSLDLPANSEVIDASLQKPCVGLTMKLFACLPN